MQTIELNDASMARIVKKCRQLPGRTLFQYLDSDGRRQCVDSAAVNAYLREITGQPFTAKKFRTWAATVLAARASAIFPSARRTPHSSGTSSARLIRWRRSWQHARGVQERLHPSAGVRRLSGRRDDRRGQVGSADGSDFSADEGAVLALLKRRSVQHAAKKSRRSAKQQESRRTENLSERLLSLVLLFYFLRYFIGP